jgi:FkbM family methyltransferase
VNLTYPDPMGGWIERDNGSVLYNSTPYAMPFSEVARRVRDAWEYDYEVKAGDVVVDIGAGVGDEVLVFSRAVGPNGHVIGIEAHPETYRRLTSIVAANGLRNVITLQLAICDSAGTVYITDGQDHLANRTGSDGNICVRAETLDQVLHDADVNSVDLLKVNIEGAEVAALKGAPVALKIAKHWAIECHDFLAKRENDPLRTYEWVISILRQSGLRVRLRDGDTGSKRYYVYGSRS